MVGNPLRKTSRDRVLNLPLQAKPMVPMGCPAEETVTVVLTEHFLSTCSGPGTEQAGLLSSVFPEGVTGPNRCDSQHLSSSTGLAGEWTPASGGDKAEAECPLSGFSVKGIPARGVKSGAEESPEFSHPSN